MHQTRIRRAYYRIFRVANTPDLGNNAGINYDTWETAENAEIDGTVVETIRTNLLGSWRVCQAFLPLLRKSKAARIVNVSSESGSLAHMGVGPPAYQVTKAAPMR